jgi:hypothetical protein
MRLQPVFIVSVPRSGSTVLTNMLDKHEDVLCLPETFFPGVMELADEAEWKDRRWMAALFVVSCSDGSPLELDEAETCIRENRQDTLDALAEAIALKAGRDPAKIRTVVWKFTRMVGCWRFAASVGGRFIILQRNPLNVYESQFRVSFGDKNRNPARFALFSSSYEAAFSDYPEERTFRLDYPGIPASMPRLLEWIGSTAAPREAESGSMGEISGQRPWHTEIDKPFRNDDARKLKNLSAWQTAGYHVSRALLSLMPSIARKARTMADQRQMNALRAQARVLLLTHAQPTQSPSHE